MSCAPLPTASCPVVLVPNTACFQLGTYDNEQWSTYRETIYDSDGAYQQRPCNGLGLANQMIEGLGLNICGPGYIGCNMEVAGDLVVSGNMNVSNMSIDNLSVCTISCAQGVVTINNILQVVETLHLISDLVVCGTISACAGSTLMFAGTVDYSFENVNVGTGPTLSLTYAQQWGDVAGPLLGPGGDTRDFRRVVTNTAADGFFWTEGNNVVYQSTLLRWPWTWNLEDVVIPLTAPMDYNWTQYNIIPETGPDWIGPNGISLATLNNSSIMRQANVAPFDHFNTSGVMVSVEFYFSFADLYDLEILPDDASVVLILATDDDGIAARTVFQKMWSGAALKEFGHFNPGIPNFDVHSGRQAQHHRQQRRPL